VKYWYAVKVDKLKAPLDIVVAANERFIQCNEDELVSLYSGMILAVNKLCSTWQSTPCGDD